MQKKVGKTSTMIVRPRPGHPAEGILRYGQIVVHCALGRSGVSARKREADGATPVAAMKLCRGFVKRMTAASSRSRLALSQTRRLDGWCDTVFDRNYNRQVRLPYQGSAETMLRQDHLYDVCIVLDWNVRRRCQGRGSAIFFHLAHRDYRPTEGCVAVSPRDMMRLLPHLSEKTIIRIL